MVNLVELTPALPRNFSSRDPEQSKFNGALTSILANYLTKMANRVNASLPKDGSEPLQGDLTVTGSITAGNVIVATYTPTLTNVANVAATTAFSVPYLLVDDLVLVGVYCQIDPTAAAPTTTTLGISLPVASNFANVNECMGQAGSSNLTNGNDTIIADVANNRAELTFGAGSLANQVHTGFFMYRVI